MTKKTETTPNKDNSSNDQGQETVLDNETLESLPENVREHIQSLQDQAEKWAKFEKRYKRVQKKFKESQQDDDWGEWNDWWNDWGEKKTELTDEQKMEALLDKRDMKRELWDEVFSEVQTLAEEKWISLADAKLIYLGQNFSNPKVQAQMSAWATWLHWKGAMSDWDVKTTRLSAWVDKVLAKHKQKLGLE